MCNALYNVQKNIIKKYIWDIVFTQHCIRRIERNVRFSRLKNRFLVTLSSINCGLGNIDFNLQNSKNQEIFILVQFASTTHSFKNVFINNTRQKILSARWTWNKTFRSSVLLSRLSYYSVVNLESLKMEWSIDLADCGAFSWKDKRRFCVT